MTTSNFGHAGLLAVATALLVACGGTGAPSLTAVPSRTAGARPSVTATLPELEPIGAPPGGSNRRRGAAEPRPVRPPLTELAATARDDAGRSRALGLRDAVRTAGTHLNVLVRAGQFATLSYDLDAVAAELEAALAAAVAQGAGDR